MKAREKKIQISLEVRKHRGKSSCVRFHFVKFEALEVCFLGLPQKPFI